VRLVWRIARNLKLGYDAPGWQQIRESAFETLGLPTDGATAVKALAQEFHDTAAQTERDLASNAGPH
jgi:hypothetical protein